MIIWNHVVVVCSQSATVGYLHQLGCLLPSLLHVCFSQRRVEGPEVDCTCTIQSRGGRDGGLSPCQGPVAPYCSHQLGAVRCVGVGVLQDWPKVLH